MAFPALAELTSKTILEGLLRIDEDGDALNRELRLNQEFKYSFDTASSDTAGADATDIFDDFGTGPAPRATEARLRIRAFADSASQEDSWQLKLFSGGITFYPGDNTSTFVGKDYVIWGKADRINPIDVLNPEDFTEFTAQEKLRRKLPNYMANLVYTRGDSKLEALVLPLYRGHLLADRESSWCQSRCQFGQPTPQPGLTVRDDIGKVDTLDYAEFAARYSSRIDRVDYSLVVHNGFDKFPLYSRTFTGPFSLEVERELLRRWSLGGDIAFNLGAFGIRAELLYQPNHVMHTTFGSSGFFNDDNGLEDVDQVSWIVGVDRTTVYDIYVNAQFTRIELLSSGDFFRPAYESLGTLQVSRFFLNDDLEVKFLGFYEFADDSWSLAPEVIYRFDDNLRWRTGVFYYAGGDTDFFGEQSDNSNVYTELKYEF